MSTPKAKTEEPKSPPEEDEEEQPTEETTDEEGNKAKHPNTRRAGTLVPASAPLDASAAMEEEIAASRESREKVSEARKQLSETYAPHPDPDLEAAKQAGNR